MQTKLQQLVDFFKYQNRLKMVLRNNWNEQGRKESSAEHSWSVTMMAWLLTQPLEAELGVKLNQNSILKMALVHDLVEIDAGDVAAWDKSGREAIKDKEMWAIGQVAERLDGVNDEVKHLWIEHDELQSTESKLVKACDQLCPLLYRLVFGNSYHGTGMTRTKLDSIFLPIVEFSQLTRELYLSLAAELEQKQLFDLENVK